MVGKMNFRDLDSRPDRQIGFEQDMLSTNKTKHTPPPPAHRAKAGTGKRTNHGNGNREERHEERHAPWEQLPDEETVIEERGELAVLHAGPARGRRSTEFPDLNITATAQRLGITKSHLAKVLSGSNRPSIELALRIADVLGKDVTYVIALYKR
jgi:hypothetical protein